MSGKGELVVVSSRHSVGQKTVGKDLKRQLQILPVTPRNGPDSLVAKDGLSDAGGPGFESHWARHG